MSITPGYKFWFKPRSKYGEQRLRAIRRKVEIANFIASRSGDTRRYRVRLAPRLGEGNPNAWKYNNKFRPRLRVEDASKVFVYVSFSEGVVRRDKPGRARNTGSHPGH